MKMIHCRKAIVFFLNLVLFADVLSAVPTNYTENSENSETNTVSGKNISVVLKADDVENEKTVVNKTIAFSPNGIVSKLDGSVSGSINETIIQNGSISNSGNSTTGSDDEPPLNLAILPVLGGFVIITVLCIKCCNRVKADVIKEREYIEDGKPLFRGEPECHPDYLSSIGSAYNSYSTVTSGYNPYNTVTTMMSNMSTVSETKDMSTMVKPRDIWRTMRQTRGTSLSLPDELAQESVLLENVVEEVKKLKDTSTSTHLSPNRKQSAPTFDRSLKPNLSPKRMHKSEEILSSRPRTKSSQIVTEVEHHKPATAHVAPVDKALGTKEESEALLRDTSDVIDSSSSNESNSGGLTPRTTDTSVESDFPNGTPRSNSVESSSDSSSPDVKNNTSPLKSNLKNSGRVRTRSVSFQESSTKKKKSSSKGRQQTVGCNQPESPNEIEITRSPLASNKNTVRRFSLSKVNDTGIQCAVGFQLKDHTGSLGDEKFSCRQRKRKYRSERPPFHTHGQSFKDLPGSQVEANET